MPGGWPFRPQHGKGLAVVVVVEEVAGEEEVVVVDRRFQTRRGRGMMIKSRTSRMMMRFTMRPTPSPTWSFRRVLVEVPGPMPLMPADWEAEAGEEWEEGTEFRSSCRCRCTTRW